jgi:hypothetical protein
LVSGNEVGCQNFDQYTPLCRQKGSAEANFIAKHVLFNHQTIQFVANLQGYCRYGADTFETKIKAALKKEIDFSRG